jgi:hypothetical protein
MRGMGMATTGREDGIVVRACACPRHTDTQRGTTHGRGYYVSRDVRVMDMDQ